MTTYKELTGVLIKRQTTNPGDPSTGEVWYNNADGNLKALGVVSAWASGSPLATARATMGGAGTQISAVVFGGVPALNTTEEYNGSGFSAGGNLNTGRSYLAGCGTQTAALGFGGYTTAPNSQGQALTEEYDGSSWTAGGAANTSRYGAAAAGIQTAAVIFGGYNNGLPPGNVTNATEEYDGSSWTTSPATLGTARYEMAGAGLQNAAIAALGYKYGSPLRTNATEEYDGSAWTAGGNANTERSSLKGGGIQTSMLVFSGTIPPPGNSDATEAYDGTSWSNQPSLATARRRPGAASNTPGSPTGLCAGGQAPSNTGATEEFTSSTNTITAAAWSSGTSLTRNHGEHIGGAGSSADGLAFGGEGPANYEYTEEWNGSTWTNGGNWPLKAESIMGCGLTGTTALGFGGIGNAPGTPPVTRQTTSATYDGSSWTATNSLPTAKRAGQGFGINTSAVCMGGDTSPTATQNTVEEWDGTNWTAVPNAPFAKGNMGGGTGTLTAGLVFGGSDPSVTGATYEYDGTNWTAGGTMNTARNQVNGWGGPAGQTASMCGGGNDGSVSAATEGYDGTSWSTRPSLGTARQGSANGIGTSQRTGVQAGGATPSYVATVEEFTGETSAANIADFTTS